MESTIDRIAQEIAECFDKIEEYKRRITKLRQTIRDLSYRAIESDDGEITHFDDQD